MNPCPCGNLGSKKKECICNQLDLARYARRLSGPIIDRIDLSVTVGTVDFEKLSNDAPDGEDTSTVRKRISAARKLQAKRFGTNDRKIFLNSDMNAKDLSRFVPLSIETKNILNQSAEKLQLSARAYHRIIKLSRTIADLAGKENVETAHILEALQYRHKI